MFAFLLAVILKSLCPVNCKDIYSCLLSHIIIRVNQSWTFIRRLHSISSTRCNQLAIAIEKLASLVFAERVHWSVYFWGVKCPVEVCQTVCELHVNVHYMLHQDRLWVMAHVDLGLLSVSTVHVWCLRKHRAIDSQSVEKKRARIYQNILVFKVPPLMKYKNDFKLQWNHVWAWCKQRSEKW